MVNSYLGDIDKQIREDRKETIRSMYLQCYTADEIAEIVGLQRRTISEEISSLAAEMEVTSKTAKTANFQDDFHYASNHTDLSCQRKDNSNVIINSVLVFSAISLSHFLVTEPSASAFTTAPLPAIRTGFY